MSSGLMETEAGGEQTQYEGISTHTDPHSKQGGQMGNTESETDVSSAIEAQDKAERGAKTAENVRYGQSISEGGMGGKTTEAGGSANQDTGFGSAQSIDGSDSTEDTRARQGYGEDSGVGG